MHSLQHYIHKFKIHDYFDADMSPHMTLQRFEKGEDILVSGQIMEDFYFIVDGKAKLFMPLENGKSLLIRFYSPLSELGSAELFLHPRIANCCVQSLYGTTVIRVPFSAIEQYAIKDTTFLQFIVKRLGQKLTSTSNAHSLNTSYPFKNRFASYLVSITRKDCAHRMDEINVDTFTDLATFLGTSYRHLSRVVKELEEDGIIKKVNKRFIILDYPRLQSLSGGFYE